MRGEPLVRRCSPPLAQRGLRRSAIASTQPIKATSKSQADALSARGPDDSVGLAFVDR